MASVYLAVAAILIAPLVGYLSASKRLSGKIGTSDAEELWAESKAMREDYREQIQKAYVRITRLDEAIHRCEERNAELMDENRDLKAKILDYQQLQDRVEHLEAENASLRKLLEAQAQTTLDALGTGEEGKEEGPGA